MPHLQIITGPDPHAMVLHAAADLEAYVRRLFHIDVTIAAAPGEASAFVILDAESAKCDAPDETEAFILRRISYDATPAIIAVGGSPVATMWAVYDLVERWGVRYLLRGDVFPSDPGEFHLPDIDVLRRPNLACRGARLLNLLSMGLESWSLADMKRYIDQLAKLKFNSVYHQLWCWQPYLHYECRGFVKSTGIHWFGWNFPIDENTIGREHFGGAPVFVPPDFEGCETYQDRVEVGINLVRQSLRHAKQRGFTTRIATVLTDFPVEFSEVLGGPPLAPHGLGQALSGGHKGADDPAFQEITATVLRAYVETYPEMDDLFLSMPEFRVKDVPYEDAWKRLDRKYGFDQVRTLDKVLEEAAGRDDYPGGAERIVGATKGDIVAHDLFDRLLDEQKVLDDTTNPGADVLLFNISEELSEVYNLMRPGVTYECGLDYTASRTVKRPEAFERIRNAGLSPSITMTTQDDNIGVVPQSATASIHDMLGILRRYDWRGFQLRYWMITEMEPTVAYLSAATWDDSVTPESAYLDHARDVCGAAAGDELVASFKILDEITIQLGDHGLGLAFPIPNIAINRWYRAGEFEETFVENRKDFRRALAHARAALAQATCGQRYLDHYIGRLEFGIGYLDMVELLAAASRANKDGDYSQAAEQLELGLAKAREIVGIQARIVQDKTDLGLLAQLNEDLCRKLAGLLEAVKAGRKYTHHADAGRAGVFVE